MLSLSLGAEDHDQRHQQRAEYRGKLADHIEEAEEFGGL